MPVVPLRRELSETVGSDRVPQSEEIRRRSRSGTEVRAVVDNEACRLLLSARAVFPFETETVHRVHYPFRNRLETAGVETQGFGTGLP